MHGSAGSSLFGSPVAGTVSRSSSTRGAAVTPVCVATPTRPPSTRPAKLSKVETIKDQSDYLRHPLMEEIASETTTNINEAAAQLMKFHGSYQQDNRDKRTSGKGKFYQFMMRTRQPAGLVSNQLYLVMDTLADKYGNGTLRLTTRQTYQLHGVLKEDLKTVFSSVIKNMGSTLGACGDVNRNVLAPPAPFKNRPEYAACEQYAQDIADLLAPQSGAYYDIWLDGEKFFTHDMERPEVTAARMDNPHGTNFEGSPEPIYGNVFLPRKFKIAITVPGDNSVDLFTNDLGLVVITDPASGELQGFNILVGGGMGRAHRNNDTFARMTDALGYVPKEDIFAAVKAIVATQRDYGRRDDRRQARLKYLVQEWGVDRFRTVTEQYYGKKMQPFKAMPAWEYKDYLGWTEQGDGNLAFGVFVQSGRLKGEMKQALRRIIERYELPVRLTPEQNVILCDIDPQWRNDIISTLQSAGVRDVPDIDPLDRLSMACPALPLCGLAIAEAERGLPDLNKRIRAMMSQQGFADSEAPVVRVTGCPNGCTRPYMAELGFVGDGPNSYQLWLGGSPNQTRLAEPFLERMKIQKLEETLEPLFYHYKQARKPQEPFGDFCTRVGFEALRKYSKSFVGKAAEEKLPQVRLGQANLDAVQAVANKQGKSLTHMLSEVVSAGLQSFP
ncbi:hypothetical protein WJX84_005131 [Apatococcus fuscideae]